MRFDLSLRFSHSLRRWYLLLAVCYAALSGAPAWAETPAEVPNPLRTKRSWVADVANVIAPEAELQINSLIEKEQKRSGNEIAVVTIRTLDGASVRDFSTDLFKLWGIGKKSKDNGVLILAAIQDRKVRIEVGYGLESELTDGVTGEIIRTSIVPAFKTENYGKGLLAGTGGVISRLGGDGAVRDSPTAGSTTAAGNTNVPARPSYEDSDFKASDIPYLLFGLFCFLGVPGLILIFLYKLIAGIFKRRSAEKCRKCGTRMRQLSPAQETQYLSEIQNFEQNLGARDWMVWSCPQCANQLITKRDLSSSYSACPKCHNDTLLHQSRIITRPTQLTQGKEVVESTCQWPPCGYHKESQRSIARLPVPPVVTSSSSSDWSSSSSNSSSSSSSSSSSDFGGGSSGGGGSDSSW